MAIAIIGAGFSGTLVATHLLRQARPPFTVHLIERDPKQFGRGVAYGTTADCHLLNVPAANMSAFPDDPEHFLRWARTRERSLLNPPWVSAVAATSFLPRGVYGDYLGEVLAEAERAAGPGVRLERILDEAVDLAVTPSGANLRLAGGSHLAVRTAVLAVGNFPPGNIEVDDPAFYESARYHGNPWAPEVLEAVLRTRSCLLIGSGLTMVDWAVTLNQAGYRGKLHLISRRGFRPQVHSPEPPVAFGLDPHGQPATVRRWLHAIRHCLRTTGCGWRAAIDALRPTTPILWESLPLAEQRRFLRHLRPFWDMHRHRLAPSIAERLKTLFESGQLVRHVGRIQSYRETGAAVEVRIRQRHSGRTETLRVETVINCSGSECNYRRLDSPLIRNLLDQGLIHPDPLALGLHTAPDGALIDADGQASDRLYALGPPRKGMLWETTAVPELRGQAARLARLLLAGNPPD